MLIKSLLLVEDGIESYREFPNGLIYLHSTRNSKGKTTFIRLLLYSLGYQIPSMRGMDFSEIRTVIIFVEKGKTFKAERIGNSYHVTVNENITLDYSLPVEHIAFLQYVFQEDNIAVISNLLGFLYIDQDKGWSLLNRGSVIGRIKFNVEELIAGLNNIDISELLEKEKQLLEQKNKYETIKNMQSYVDVVFSKNGEFFSPEIDKELMNRISYKKIEIQRLKESIKELNSAIDSQERLLDYIDSMKLVVSENGVEIKVSKNSIKGAIPSTELLKARRSILSFEIDKISKEIKELEISLEEQKRKDASYDLLNSSSKHNMMYYELNSFLESNQANVSELIDDLKIELNKVRTQINNLIKNNNRYINDIYNKVYEYSKFLGVDDKIIQKENYIFTSDLRSLSGTILSKIIFAFKLAFLRVIEDKIETKFVFIIDSPGAKEMDKQNFELILKLMRKEIKDNQIFIATLFEIQDFDKKYDFDGLAIEPQRE